MSQISGASATFAPNRPRRVLVMAAVIGVAGILAATGYALTRSVTPVATIGCYETDSLDANTAVIASGTKSPVATCAREYASAFPGSRPPAHFTACVLPSGAVGVFPGASGETCKSLGLAAASGGN